MTPELNIWVPPSARGEQALAPGELDRLVSYACAMRAAQGFELALAVTAIRLRRKRRPIGIRQGDTAEKLAKRIEIALSSGQASLTRATATSLAKEIAPELSEQLATDVVEAAKLRNQLAHDFFRAGLASQLSAAQQATAAGAAQDALESVTARLMAEREAWRSTHTGDLPAGQLPIPDVPALDALLENAASSMVGGSRPSFRSEVVEFAQLALSLARVASDQPH